MKKIILVFLALTAVLVLRGQNLIAKLEGTTFNKRKFTGDALFSWGRLTADACFQADGEKMYGFSTGYDFSRSENIVLSLLPGVSWVSEDNKKIFYYTCALIWRSEALGRVENSVQVKGFKSFKDSSMKFIAEGELLARINRSLKIGPSFLVESKKVDMNFSSQQINFFETVFLLSVKCAIHPYFMKKFSLYGSLGWENKAEDGGKFLDFSKESIVTNRIVFSAGLELRL